MPHMYDIFISYGHLDDEDPAGDVKGWVDLLVERLPRLVSNNLGYLPKIWRDERSLHGNDLLTAAINEGVTSALLLIPIVSPRYVQSDWCRRELEAFCQSEPPPGAPAFRSRIFKVIKTPLLFHLAKKEPESLRELIGYSFYEMEGDMPVEFGPEVTPTKDPRYWTALRRLAWDVSNMLATLKHAKDAITGPLVAPTPQSSSSPVAAAANTGTNKFVYLAETTSDLTSERELVRDELRQRGYGVLPEEKLPAAELQQIQTVVTEALARCVLSVHLIGKRYGSTPEDDPRSLVCIQEDLAAQHCAKHSDFSRLLWMPQGLMTPALEVTDERQKQFITGVQNRIGSGAELLQTSIEDLKTRIVEKLSPPPAAKAAATTQARSKLKQVYLICENRDRGLVRPIKEYLFKQNLEVITWLDGEGRALMDYHHKNLRECDAALVYFGNGDEPWVRKNLEDLEKAYGYGREQDWSVSAVYVGAPQSDQKEDFLTHLVPYVIRNYQSFDPNDLRDFVAAVQASEGEQR
ncbi:MAG TPA: TIR domain-containing protein [Pyrinomonadaceae bacterium]|nr:TIR domain-containing protein [Pyrinomonadaceae bacterium]